MFVNLKHISGQSDLLPAYIHRTGTKGLCSHVQIPICKCSNDQCSYSLEWKKYTKPLQKRALYSRILYVVFRFVYINIMYVSVCYLSSTGVSGVSSFP